MEIEMMSSIANELPFKVLGHTYNSRYDFEQTQIKRIGDQDWELIASQYVDVPDVDFSKRTVVALTQTLPNEDDHFGAYKVERVAGNEIRFHCGRFREGSGGPCLPSFMTKTLYLELETPLDSQCILSTPVPFDDEPLNLNQFEPELANKDEKRERLGYKSIIKYLKLEELYPNIQTKKNLKAYEENLPRYEEEYGEEAASLVRRLINIEKCRKIVNVKWCALYQPLENRLEGPCWKLLN